MPVEQCVAAVELDGVALPIIEAQRFDMREALQRPGKACRGVLPPENSTSAVREAG